MHEIIGACNPEFAEQLFSAGPNIGRLIPCNIMDIIKSPLAIATVINVKCRMEEMIEDLANNNGAHHE